MYVHLHGHSHYSFLDAIGKVPDILARVQELGMTSVGVSDYYGMYGIIDLYQTAKKMNIKPIIGVELPFVFDRNHIVKQDRLGYIILIAQNTAGYFNILKIVSEAHLGMHEGKPYCDFALLKDYTEGVMVMVGGEQSYLGLMLDKKESEEKIKETIQTFAELFTPERTLLELIAQPFAGKLLREKSSALTLNFAAELGLKVVVNTNFHYIMQSDKEAYECALCIKRGIMFSDRKQLGITGDFHIASEDEIRAVLVGNGYQEELIDARFANNVMVAEQCDVSITLNQALFPNYESAPEIHKMYEEFITNKN